MACGRSARSPDARGVIRHGARHRTGLVEARSGRAPAGAGAGRTLRGQERKRPRNRAGDDHDQAEPQRRLIEALAEHSREEIVAAFGRGEFFIRGEQRVLRRQLDARASPAPSAL
jgi:hypothetical protein